MPAACIGLSRTEWAAIVENNTKKFAMHALLMIESLDPDYFIDWPVYVGAIDEYEDLQGPTYLQGHSVTGVRAFRDSCDEGTFDMTYDWNYVHSLLDDEYIFSALEFARAVFTCVRGRINEVDYRILHYMADFPNGLIG